MATKKERPVIVIPVSGDIYKAAVSSLEDHWSLVGGYVQPIKVKVGNIRATEAYVNEDGKWRGLHRNTRATEFAAQFLMPGDYIAGTMVIKGTEKDGVSEELLNHFSL